MEDKTMLSFWDIVIGISIFAFMGLVMAWFIWVLIDWAIHYEK